jgi:uncharacterized PurR-regulated membrane protein YhhQ (DUF165 family)
MKVNYHLYKYRIVILYLLAVVLANVSVSIFGPASSVINAFLFIGLNLTSRDKLHDTWHGENLWRNMFVLILLGALISAAFGAGRIALASFLAFMSSETADALVYSALESRAHLVKINGSNVVSAAVDSLIFPVVAFGAPVLWVIIVGQFVAKVGGGFIWSLILNRSNYD